MVKNISCRSPLRDITVDALRQSRRRNGVAKSCQDKAFIVQKAAPGTKNGTILCKVEAQQVVGAAVVVAAGGGGGKRRKSSTSSRHGGSSPKKKRAKIQETQHQPSQGDVHSITVDIRTALSSLVLVAQPMISVPDEDVWLCEPLLTEDMLSYTKSLESRHRLPVNYLTECRSRVTDEMRATLVNWLVEIHGHLKLEPETLHIAVKLLDATLHRFDIGVTRLQLCGLAVFWIASKLENNPLAARDLLQLMCYVGDSSILVHMEEQVLKVLQFRVQVAEPIFFLNRLLLYDENGRSQELMDTCCYLMDSFLHNTSIVDILPSDLAASALLAARYIDGVEEWPLALAYATGHWPTPDDLRPLAVELVRTVKQAADLSYAYSGAFRKYSSRKRYSGLSKSDKFQAAHLADVIDALATTTPIFIC